MHKKIGKVTTVLAASSMLAISGAAMATNGYFTHGVGTESKGMAGTGIGSNAMNGPIVTASNPALSYFADDGWEVGLSFFSPMRSYEASSSLAMGQGGAFTVDEAKIDSSSEWFPIPYVAKNWRLSNGNVIGTAFYGRGGMNTDWDDSGASATSGLCDPTGQGNVVTGPGPFCSGESGVDLSQAFLIVNYSGGSDRFSWGIGPVLAVQAFEAKGVASYAPFTKTFNDCFFTIPPGTPPNLWPCDPTPTALTDNGHEFSTGVGGVAGLWWAIADSVSVGLSYQSKIGMSEFDDYADLFAEQGGFDIPSSLKFGLSFAGSNDVRLNLDVEHTRYSEIGSVGNPMANLFNCPFAVSAFTGTFGGDFEDCLGGKTGGGFGWEDMTTYKMGIEWTGSDTTTWRFGYSYGEQPIQAADITFNILAPGVMEQHFTIGMTRKRANGGAWSFSLMYAPSNTVSGVNEFDPTQTIDLEMKQFELEISYLF
ncbi:MAG: OmpP1/FadL family transporter [Woeseiaceae bacterium]